VELITHNLVGVTIQILCFSLLIYPLNFIFTMIFAFISHYLIDILSKFTYHTPEARKDDKFWVTWHIIILIASIASLIIFFPFWLGMLFANLVDIWDWLILRPIQKRIKKSKPDSKWGDNLYFHKGVDWLRDKLFSKFPNWNYKRQAIIFELVIIALLILTICLLLL